MVDNSQNHFISIKNLIKIYKLGSVDVTALRGVNLTIKKGEFLAIVGPSGSGKSTLLNIIGGVSNPTAGKVVIDGEDISYYSTDQLVEYRKSKVGFMWQFINLLPDLSVKDNLKLTMIACGKFKGAKMKARIDYLLDNLKIDHRVDHRPSQLSGGELQRAALAIALANDPEIILADEPTGELDTETGEAVMRYLKQVANQELGKTLIIVSHAPEVARMAERMVVIQDGVLTGQRRGNEELFLSLDPQGKIQLPVEVQKTIMGRNVRIMTEKNGSIILQPVED
ncbi:MAG: ABC transporter ATP-binding protein [Candidatus Hodarchaeales archaeon]|jgi:putative ABC transport system ATP-binding protein